MGKYQKPEEDDLRIQLRKEFIIRSGAFQNMKEQIEREMKDHKAIMAKKNKMKIEAHVLRICNLADQLFSNNPMLGASFIATAYVNEGDPGDFIANYLARENMSPIEILIKGNEEPEYHFLDYGERDYFEYYSEKLKSERKGKFFYRQFVLDGIDKEDKTIQVKIHIDQNKDQIKKDIALLLDLIDFETERLGADIERQRQRLMKGSTSIWEKYTLYLRVWDSVERKGKSIRCVARKIFPEDFKEQHPKSDDMNAYIPNPESAEKKTKHYYKEAKKLINGGWRMI